MTRTVATLHSPVNVKLLQAALDDAGPEGIVTITGVGTTARLVITAAEELLPVPPADGA